MAEIVALEARALDASNPVLRWARRAREACLIQALQAEPKFEQDAPFVFRLLTMSLLNVVPYLSNPLFLYISLFSYESHHDSYF